MCRLVAIVGGVPPHLRSKVLDRMLIVASADASQGAFGGHTDGTGISDGEYHWKTSKAAPAAGLPWVNALEMARPLVGHVRRKSTGTGATALEAHPYPFVVEATDAKGGKKEPRMLHVAHNGYFTGVRSRLWASWNDPAVPNSDTYWAGHELATLLADRDADELTPALLTEWLSEYNGDSAFALMLYYNGQLTVIRGPGRSLHVLPLGADLTTLTIGQAAPVLIATTPEILESTYAYLSAFWPKLYPEKLPAIEPIPERHMLQFASDGTLVRSETLSYRLHPVSSFSYGTFGQAVHGSREEKKKEAGVAQPHGGNSGATTLGERTAPAATTTATAIEAAAVGETTQKQQRVRKLLRGATAHEHVVPFMLEHLTSILHPMTEPLVRYWAETVVRKSHSTAALTGAQTPALTVGELDRFYTWLMGEASTIPGYASGHTKLLLPVQESVIQYWNTTVPEAAHAFAARYLFADEPFWEVTRGGELILSPEDLATYVGYWTTSSERALSNALGNTVDSTVDTAAVDTAAVDTAAVDTAAEEPDVFL
jgi:hypothetical protein